MAESQLKYFVAQISNLKTEEQLRIELNQKVLRMGRVKLHSGTCRKLTESSSNSFNIMFGPKRGEAVGTIFQSNLFPRLFMKNRETWDVDFSRENRE